MEDPNEVINSIYEKVEKPLVTPRFGDNWKEHVKEEEGEYDRDTLINMAWTQGRRAILLEDELHKRIVLQNEIQKPEPKNIGSDEPENSIEE